MPLPGLTRLTLLALLMGPEIFAVSYSEVQKKLDKIGSYRVLQRLENVSQELIRETTKSGKTDKELARELARTRLLLS